MIFDYSDPAKHAGIRFESDSSKVVYLSFGFEAISSFDDRVTLLARILDWFGGLSGVDQVSQGTQLRIYPNPAATYLSIDASQGGLEEIRIYDALGRLIKEFHASAYPQKVLNWDLSDSQGTRVASGIYFLTVRANGTIFKSKIALIR